MKHLGIVILASFLALSSPAWADHHKHKKHVSVHLSVGGRSCEAPRYVYVAPAPRIVYYEPAPIYQPPVVYVTPSCPQQIWNDRAVVINTMEVRARYDRSYSIQYERNYRSAPAPRYCGPPPSYSRPIACSTQRTQVRDHNHQPRVCRIRGR